MTIMCQDLFGLLCGLQLSGWDNKLNNHQQRVSTDCAWMFDVMSFMYIKNRAGPRADPWGTPDVTLQGEDCLYNHANKLTSELLNPDSKQLSGSTSLTWEHLAEDWVKNSLPSHLWSIAFVMVVLFNFAKYFNRAVSTILDKTEYSDRAVRIWALSPLFK